MVRMMTDRGVNPFTGMSSALVMSKELKLFSRVVRLRREEADFGIGMRAALSDVRSEERTKNSKWAKVIKYVHTKRSGGVVVNISLVYKVIDLEGKVRNLLSPLNLECREERNSSKNT